MKTVISLFIGWVLGICSTIGFFAWVAWYWDFNALR